MRLGAKRLMARGVPVKDFKRLIFTEFLSETEALGYARDWLAKDRSVGTLLVLAGGVGTGKTTAAAWLAAQDTPADFGWPGSGVPWPPDLLPRFVDASEFAEVNRYDGAQMDALRRCPLLAIDDLGTEFSDGAGSFLTTLGNVLSTRHRDCLRTVITTNLPAAEFLSRYGERLRDRLVESGAFVELDGESLRRNPPPDLPPDPSWPEAS
jgi:DNA replication protein DnaC